MKIKIGKRFVGGGEPCFIIAEAGVNHNGSLRLAKKLVDAAVATGADAVKFQSFSAEKLALKSAKKARYQLRTTGKKGTQFNMLKRLELSGQAQRALAQYAKKKKIIFFSTPYDQDSVKLLQELRVPVYKVASADITNIPLLERIAATKKPVILSTGMASLQEISEALRTIKKAGNKKIILLQCVTEYPAPTEHANVLAMRMLSKTFRTIVGYSDHTTELLVPLVAAAHGAAVIEKHFTLSRKMRGPDHFASLEPEMFREMVDEIRKVEVALGDGKKTLTRAELQNKKVMRRGVYAAIDIKKGVKIKKNMLAFMRPESSLKPRDYSKLIGKMAKKDIKAGQELKLGYFGK